MWIGIVGKTAVGKTTISNFIKTKYIKRFKIIHLDSWVKKIYNIPAVRLWLTKKINQNIIQAGKINFLYLKKVLFENIANWKKLNVFLMPFIEQKLDLIKKKHKYCIVEGSIIFTSKLDKFMDKNIFVKTKDQIVLKRQKKFNTKELKILWNFQKEIESGEKKSDYVIENNTTKDNLYAQTSKIINFWLKEALRHQKD